MQQMITQAVRRVGWGPVAGILAALFLSGAGCFGHHRSDAPAPATAMAPQPAGMEGVGTFFAGDLSVTVTVTSGNGRGANAAGAGGRHGHRGGAADDSDAAATTNGGSPRADGPTPPITLRLKFENRSKQTLKFSVEDLKSDLGNFAVHPKVMNLSPDQSSEPDAMTSKLALTADEILVKLTLKLGGRKESETILVKNVQTSNISDWPGLRE
jgi:hypothetical protein